MLMTKNAAELCTLLVSELYGQLPSRIIAALLARGRSDVRELALHTSLTPKQIRHGLALVIQHNLVYYHTDHETGNTKYEANPTASYHLVRVGKILDMIDQKYGSLAKQLVDDVLTVGTIEVDDLVRYHKAKQQGRRKTALNGTANHEGYDEEDYDEEEEGENDDFEHDLDDDSFKDEDDPFAEVSKHVNGHINGNGTPHLANEDIATDDQIYHTLSQLIVAGIIESVSSDMLQPPQDFMTALEQEVASKEFPNGVRGTKAENDLLARVTAETKAIAAERSTLKRKLQDSAMHEPTNIKRRKLVNGAASGVSNSFAGSNGAVILREEDSNAVIRLNFDKCMVDLRNQRLAEYAEDFVGDTSAKVFVALLSTLCKRVYRCQYEKDAIVTEEEDAARYVGRRVTTEEVFEHLDADVDLSMGIGTASEDQVDVRYAERIRKFPPQDRVSRLQESVDDGDVVMGSDDEEYDQSAERPLKVNGHHRPGGKSGAANGELDAEEDTITRAKQLRQMRQHLLLLAEAKQGFIRHCGQNQWTVDFEPLVQQLRFAELDTMIEDSFGRYGLRLTRILREKGKLDDKTLPTLALMKKVDVHVTMAAMEMAGFLEVQEVPRDNNRAANRTIFFWFFDEKRTLRRTLDNTYKTMVRCLQRLEVERYKKKNVLSVTARRDVQGHEEEKLRGDVYNEYLEYLDIEKKILSQLLRLDDLVAIFQDF